VQCSAVDAVSVADSAGRRAGTLGKQDLCGETLGECETTPRPGPSGRLDICMGSKLGT